MGRVWVWVRAAGSGGGTGSSEAGNLWARLAATRPQECIHLVLSCPATEEGKKMDDDGPRTPPGLNKMVLLD